MTYMVYICFIFLLSVCHALYRLPVTHLSGVRKIGSEPSIDSMLLSITAHGRATIAVV